MKYLILLAVVLVACGSRKTNEQELVWKFPTKGADSGMILTNGGVVDTFVSGTKEDNITLILRPDSPTPITTSGKLLDLYTTHTGTSSCNVGLPISQTLLYYPGISVGWSGDTLKPTWEISPISDSTGLSKLAISGFEGYHKYYHVVIQHFNSTLYMEADSSITIVGDTMALFKQALILLINNQKK